MATRVLTWSVAAGIAVVVLASVFVQGGNGAIFAITPVINRHSAWQTAGIVGAYGAVGRLVLSSIPYFTIAPAHRAGSVPLVFTVIAGSALVVAILCRNLPNDAPVVSEARDLSVVIDADLGEPVETALS